MSLFINFFQLLLTLIAMMIISYRIMSSMNLVILEKSFYSEHIFLKKAIHLSLSWFLAIGLIGTYFLNCFLSSIDHQLAFHILFLLAVISLMVIFKNNNFKFHLKDVLSFKKNFPIEYKYKIILLGLLILFCNYFYRSLVPWYDEDEIYQYGPFHKLIKSGHFFSDFVEMGRFSFHYIRPKFATCLNSFFYLPILQNIPIRIFKFTNLFFVSVLFFSFIFQNTKNLKYSLLSILLFLGTPELSYLATSLKDDSLLMTFEVVSLIIFFLIFLDKKSIILKGNYTSTLILSFIFSQFAFSSRESYVAIFLTLFVCHHIIFSKFLSINKKFFYLSMIASIHFIILSQFYINIIKFGNPIPSIKATWPFTLMDRSQFLDQWSYSRWKYLANLRTSWPLVIERIYLIFHISLGLETTIFDRFTFIPHAFAKGNSLGWMSPTLLILFVAPLFYKKLKEKNIIMFTLVIIFIIWSSGIQITRAFHTSSPLAISLMIFIILIDTNSLSKTQKIIQQLLKKSIFLLSLFLVSYQTLYSLKKYPHSLFSILSKDYFFQSNSNLLQLKFSSYYPKGSLNKDDFQMFNDKIKELSHDKKLIWIIPSQLQIIHILFDDLIFLPAYSEFKNKLSHFRCIFIDKKNSFLSHSSEIMKNKQYRTSISSSDKRFELSCL